MNLRQNPKLISLAKTLVFVVGALSLWLVTANAQAAFPILGNPSTPEAEGLPKDRHVVMLGNNIVSVYLENLDGNLAKGVLRFRKSADGFVWSEALSNPSEVLNSGVNFFLAKDMAGNPSCATAADCNLYIVYFRNNATSCAVGGDQGNVYFRELTYDNNTALWKLQPELKITDDTVWWDTYWSWNVVCTLCSCRPHPPAPSAEPKPQVWVEGTRAMILYDIQTLTSGWDDDQSGYTYLRTRSLTKNGTAWGVDTSPGSARDVGVMRNCSDYYWPEPWIRRPNTFTYAALVKNPLTNNFGVVVNRTIPGWGSCGVTPSNYDAGPLLEGGGNAPPGYGDPGWQEPFNAVYSVPLQYIGNNQSGFSWNCGRAAGDITTALTPCNRTILDNQQYPGPNFSVEVNNPTAQNQKAMRVAYSRYDYDLARHHPTSYRLYMKEWRLIGTSTYDWAARQDLSTLTGFPDQYEIVPMLSSAGDDYWVIAQARVGPGTTCTGDGGACGSYQNCTGAGGICIGDDRTLYRKMSFETPDLSDPATWNNTPVYPAAGVGEVNFNGSGTSDRTPTAPADQPADYLTSAGHPSFVWSYGNTNPFTLSYPEDGNLARVNGWGWAPTIGWVSLDYLNTGKLGDIPYGVHICLSNAGGICPAAGTSQGRVVNGQMWSPTVGWITFDYNAATQCGGIGKAKGTWTANGVQVNATPSSDPTVDYINRSKAVVETSPGNGFEVVWQRNDSVNGTNIYMQRRDNATGASLIGADKVIVDAPGTQSDPQIVFTWDGYFIIAWSDNRNGNYDIYAQKVDVNGNVAAGWPANGIQVSDAGQSSQQQTPQLVADNTGGAYVIWSDERGGVGAGDIYMQWIQGNGTRWANDVAVVAQPNRQAQYKLALMSDGSAMVVWTDCRSTDSPGTCPGGFAKSDIYYQRINSAGAVQYAANGVLLTDDVGGNKDHGDNPFIVSSFAGRAIILHGRRASGEKNLHGIDSATGNVLWDQEVNTVSEYSSENYSDAIRDGSGGMIFAWSQGNVTANGSTEILVRRVDSNGVLSWDNLGGRGFLLTDTGGGSTSPRLTVDLSLASVLVSWIDSSSGKNQVYAQKITNGKIDWDANGFQVTNMAGGFTTSGTFPANLSLIRHNVGGKAIAVWTDERAGISGDGQNNDVYAQLVEDATPILCSSGPPAATTPALPAGVLARYNPDNNRLEGWARVISLKNEGERVDGSSADGTVNVDCSSSEAGTNACDWGWMRLGGSWSVPMTSLTQPFNNPSTVAYVLSTLGYPTMGLLFFESDPPGFGEELAYTAKTSNSFTVSAAPAENHSATRSVYLTAFSGTYAVGAHYLDDVGAYQLFDFAYSPAIGWIQFLPFRFVGFPFAQTKSGDIYSAQNITLPAPPTSLESVGEFTSTYLIQADGTIQKQVSYGQRSAKGATSGSGTPAQNYQDPGVLQENQGLNLGFPGIGSSYGDYTNALGKIDITKLTTIVANCKDIGTAPNFIGVSRNCDDMRGDGATTTDDNINTQSCIGPGAWKTCANDGSGTNIYGTEVVVRHNAADGRYEIYADSHPLFRTSNWNLGGKIWYYPNSDMIFYNNNVVKNATTGSGAGIIISKSVKFQGGGLTYDSVKPDTVKKLASLLWIVSDNVDIYPTISSLAGSYVAGISNPAKGVFDTCFTTNLNECKDYGLTVNGIVMARELKFNRSYYGDPTQDIITTYAERIVNDGRLLANPPPGIEDFSQALPRFQQVKP